MLINGKEVSSIFFQEEVKNLTLDNYFDCLHLDYEKLIKYYEKSNYLKMCLIKVEGQKPKLVGEGRYEFSGIQVAVCFINDEDKSAYKVSSTVAEDIRIADIYSVHLAHMVCTVLGSRTNIVWGTFPLANGVYSIAPEFTIKTYMEDK